MLHVSGEEDLCPSTFINGKISRHCSRQPGDLCSYSCNPDCTKSSVAMLRCRDNKTWDHSTALLCKKSKFVYLNDIK